LSRRQAITAVVIIAVRATALGRDATTRVVSTLLGVVLAAVLAGTAAAAPLAVPAATGVRVQPFAIYGAARNDTILLTAPATVSVAVTIPPSARLISAVAVPDQIWTAKVADTAQAVRFRVLFESAGATTTLYERVVDIARRPADRRWFDFGRDLAAWGGQQGTLHFETTLADPSAPPGTVALWAPPDLASCNGADPSVVVIIVDALRADHLSGYGYARPTSPRLDAFAARASRFTAAFSAGPKTIPSVPQTLTGSIFYRHRDTPGIGFLGPHKLETSRAVVNNPWVALWLPTEQPTFNTVVSGELDARAITSEGLRWLTAAGRCPTALYLHYLDTHTPYRPPPRYARQFIDPNAKTTVGLTFDDVTGAWQDRYEGADRQRIIDLYDGAIAWTDRQLGRLFRGLTRRGLLDRTMVVVTADHGEELWEHGKFFHGQSLYDELLHVPLIVHAPGQREARQVNDLASTIDVVPTVVDVAQLAPVTGDGRSLVPLLSAGGAASPGTLASRDGGTSPGGVPSPDARTDRTIFATVSYPEPRTPPRHAVRSATRKLIRTITDGQIELYDLVADPREQRNLGLAGPGGRELLAALDAIRLRLADVGDHLRLQSRSDQPVRYIVTLATDPSVPIVDQDRLTLERDDYLRIGPLSTSLTVSGTLDPGEEDHVRMDVLASTGKLKVTIALEGTPAPDGTLRVGASGRPAAAAIDLADPALVGAPSAASGATETTPVVVSLWRVPRRAGGTAPAIDPATRERLRQLGYAQ